MGSILSTLCKEKEFSSKHPSRQTRNARSASSFHGSYVEKHEHSSHQSAVYAHNNSDASPADACSVHPGSSVPSRRARKRTYAVFSRYSRAAKHPDVSNMIQRHREEDRKAGQEYNDIMTKVLLSRDKRWKRFKKYHERTLGVHQQTSRGNRVSKTPSRKPPQQIKVNEKYVNIGKQKKGLDRLFAEAGY